MTSAVKSTPFDSCVTSSLCPLIIRQGRGDTLALPGIFPFSPQPRLCRGAIRLTQRMFTQVQSSIGLFAKAFTRPEHLGKPDSFRDWSSPANIVSYDSKRKWSEWKRQNELFRFLSQLSGQCSLSWEHPRRSTKLTLKATMVVTEAFSQLHIVIPVTLSLFTNVIRWTTLLSSRCSAAGEVAKLVKCLSPKHEDGP